MKVLMPNGKSLSSNLFQVSSKKRLVAPEPLTEL